MFKLNGFPELTDYIELPSIGELLRVPFFYHLSADDAYKHGGETVRYLLSKTPLSNKMKYVNITCQVQYITPNYMAVQSIVTRKNDWHGDGSGMNSPDRYYLLLNDTHVNTHFNANPIAFPNWKDTDDQSKFIHWLNEHLEEIPIEPVRLPGGRMAVFGFRNFHSAVQARYPELRFMWRVHESDHMQPKAYDPDRIGTSVVYIKQKPYPNIEQQKDGSILIHNAWGTV